MEQHNRTDALLNMDHYLHWEQQMNSQCSSEVRELLEDMSLWQRKSEETLGV